MKHDRKLFFLLLLAAMPWYATAQVTLEKTFQGHVSSSTSLWASLPVLYLVDTEANRIYLYDASDNYTLLADLDILRIAPENYQLSQLFAISQHYVNTDNLYELYIICQNPDLLGSNSYAWSAIINENGQIIKDFGYASIFTGYYIQIANSYKFLLNRYLYYNDAGQYVGSIQSEIYTLQGTPDAVTTVTEEPALPFPNPASQTITLPYQPSANAESGYIYDTQGRLIERCHLPAGTHEYVLPVSAYPQGTYFFQVGERSLPFVVN